MAKKSTQIQLRGEFHWAKVTGDPRMNDFTKEREWSIDISPNAAGLKACKAVGIADKLKDPKEGDVRTGQYLTLRQREMRTDKVTGEAKKNRPPKIEQANGAAWPADTLIGNGTVGDILVTVVDNGPGFQKGTYIGSIRVLDLVPYGGSSFTPLSEDDEYFGKAVKAPAEDYEKVEGNTPEDLDDDIPF